jgi:hypothetical protein
MENLQQAQVTEYREIPAEEQQNLVYWSREFGISMDELVAAVKAGLSSSQAVENYVKHLQFTA